MDEAEFEEEQKRLTEQYENGELTLSEFHTAMREWCEISELDNAQQNHQMEE